MVETKHSSACCPTQSTALHAAPHKAPLCVLPHANHSSPCCPTSRLPHPCAAHLFANSADFAAVHAEKTPLLEKAAGRLLDGKEFGELRQ